MEYVRGMSVVKAFNQTASSFKKLKEAITGYTEWVLKFSPGLAELYACLTTIINNVYLILVPVGILIGTRTDDFAGFAMTFYLLSAFYTSNFRCAEQNHVYFRVVHADQRECGQDGRDIEHSRNAGNGSS